MQAQEVRSERTQLDRWAEHHATIQAVVDAISEAEGRGLLDWTGPLSPLAFACELYEVDLAALDRQRRVLLDQHRRRLGETPCDKPT